jgi:hypothetical protein
MRALVLVLALHLPAAVAEEPPDIAGIPSQDITLREGQRYFLIGAEKERGKAAPSPKPGHGLLVVLPGGDGGEGFLPFVKRIHANTLGQGWLTAQPVAVKWKPDQEVIWPTEKLGVPGMKFTTEAFVEAVIADVKKRHRVDPARIHLLAWSSSGPAAYSLSLSKKKSVAGFYIAMSVFKPDTLPPLDGAKGNAYFLDHSPDDRVCPFRMAEDARSRLEKAGARAKLVTYEGGHGWHGDFYGRLREGWKWLEENRPKAKR